MKIIDPHIHMSSRTTDDYQALSLSGVHTVSEPASWPGFRRGTPESFHCYFYQLAVSEPARAEKFGIRHYSWIGLNGREAENLDLAQDVVTMIPEYLYYPTVLGVGEIGLSRNSRNELKVLELQIELAAERDQLILIHTPHLEDKLKGTRLIIGALSGHPRIDPGRVLIDHAEEHTIGEILDKGFWAGISVSASPNMSPGRAADMIETFGTERICINSSADRDPSDPLATVRTAGEMRRRRHSGVSIAKVFHDNPVIFLAQSPNFEAQ